MKNIVTIPFMVGLATVVSYAQGIPVKMTFSGTGGASAIDLKQPNTHTGEENVAGFGTLGQFTLRDVRASSGTPTPNNTCMGPYFATVSGAAVMRFQDGSVLKLSLEQGGDCIDLVNVVGHCVLVFKITGGTGRFKNASGMLTYSETAVPLTADGTGNPVYFMETGDISGTISGLGGE